MGMKTVNYLLAALGLGGHLLLTTALIRRRLTVRLPLFTILIVFYLLRSGILLLANFKGIEPWPYWILIAIDPVLQCVLYAAIVHAWWDSAFAPKNIPALAGLSLLLIAVGLAGLAAWCIGPSSHFSPENLSIKTGIFVSVLWIESGLALAASSGRHVKELPRLTRKVVQGFAIYSAANVITEIGHRHFATLRSAQPYLGLSYLRVGIYLFSLSVWIMACSREPLNVPGQAR
jgi:hypothetical protein